MDYNDYDDLKGIGYGHLAIQPSVRAEHPDKDGVLKVYGNEYHYGERAWFWTHNSFIGECRFFHNARFLGQATFDKEIVGTVMRSRWADLAEYRKSDKQYEPGTLVMFGGEKEVTLSDGHTCNAIVTTNPGLVLNGGEPSTGNIMVGIALTGTVPVNVVGDVNKFDKLVPSSRYRGYARRRHWYDFFRRTIGIALTDSKGGQVECITKMEF